MITCKWFLLTIICLYSISLLAVTIGSDTAVMRFDIQQQFFNGDVVAAFAGIDDGFEIFGINNITTWRSVFPASGDIALQGGTLFLQGDLVLYNDSQVTSLGNITGNGYALDLAACTTCIPNATDMAIDCAALFVDSVAGLPADAESVDWSFDSQYVVAGLDNTTGTVRVYQFDGSSLTEVATLSPEGNNQEIAAIRWHPTKYIIAGIRRAVSNPDGEVFTLEFDPVGETLTVIDSDQILDSEDDDGRGIAWHPTGNFLAATLDNNSGEILIYTVDASGNIGTPSLIEDITPNRNPRDQSIEWDSTGNYLAVGLDDSGSNPTLLVYEFDSGTPALTLNSSIDAGGQVEGVDWSPTCTNLIAIVRRGSGNDFEIYEHKPNELVVADRLDSIAGVNVPGFPFSVAWSPDGNCLAIGKNTSNTGEFRVYAFDIDVKTLASTPVSSFNLTGNVLSVRWAQNGRYIVNGSQNNSLSVYQANASDGSDNVYTFSDLALCLNCDLELKKSDLQFEGNSSINGRGHVLTLQSTATLSVKPNSSLLFKDITIKQVNGNNIRCLDYSSAISFDQVTYLLDANYSFTVGAFDVLREFTITGSGNTFMYQTDQQSNILACGKLMLDNGITFDYNPTIASGDLIALTKDTSQIIMNGATIHSTTTGLRLTRGILVVDDNSTFASDATVQSEAIVFGDGITKNNNLCVQWLAEAGFELTSGILRYNNV